MKTILFHNPTAGDGNHSAEALTALLRQEGYRVRYVSTKEKAAMKEALEEPAELRVIAGGDGTVAKVLKRLKDRETPLAILPLGGANNIARSLGLLAGPEALVAGWRGAPAFPLDIGRISGPWGAEAFVEAVGYGALAHSLARCPEYKGPPEEKLRQGRAAFREILAGAAPAEVEVVLDETRLEGSFLFGELMNIAYAGPALPLARHGELGDGLLEFIGLEAERRREMLDWLDAVEPKGPPPVTLRRASRAMLVWKGEPLRIDDDFPEPLGRPVELRVSLDPRGVQVLVPAGLVAPPPAEGILAGRSAA